VPAGKDRARLTGFISQISEFGPKTGSQAKVYHELVTQPVEGRSDLPTTVGLHELQSSLLPV